MAEQEGSGLRREAVSNPRGEFRIDYLPPGAYHLVVSAQGFVEAHSEVTVVVNSVREVLVTLGLPTMRQTLKVQSPTSSIATRPIDATTAVHEGALTTQDLQTVPLAHRTFANIAYLVPGTEPVEPSDPTKARITAVSFGGSSGLNVQLSVDGADNSDDYIGGFSAKFLARHHPGVCCAHLARRCGYRTHHGRFSGDRHQARNRPVAREAGRFL
jgi:hypothetical protein